MAATIILDTCFLIWLEQYDALCHELGFHPPIPENKMPWAGLDFLIKHGCNLVIPNEVLKEMTGKNGDRVGLTLGENHSARFNPAVIEHLSHHPTLQRYLSEKQAQGKLRCFAFMKDYLGAAKNGSVAGSISIVAASPEKDRYAKSPSPGDDEIVDMMKEMKSHKLRGTSGIVCTMDHELSTRIHAVDNFYPVLSHATFLEMQRQMGSIHPWLISDTIFSLFEKRYESEDRYQPLTMPQESGKLRVRDIIQALHLPQVRGEWSPGR